MAATFRVSDGQTNINGTTVIPPHYGVPFDDLFNRIRSVINSGGSTDPNFPKSTNVMKIGNMPTSGSAEIVNADATKLPNLAMWDVDNPPFRVWVYTNASGTSSIVGNSTPGAPVELVQNGSRLKIGTDGQVISNNGAIAGIIIGVIMFLMICTGIIYFVTKK